MPTNQNSPLISGYVKEPRNRNAVLAMALAAALVGWTLFFVSKYRTGPLSFTIKLPGLAEVKIDQTEDQLKDVLGKVLQEADRSGDEAKNAVYGVFAGYHLFRIPSLEAADAIRGYKETDETDVFGQALRQVLYDLQGPFSTPKTFKGADDRLVSALDDLYKQNKDSQIVVSLVDKCLRRDGLFRASVVKISVFEDRALRESVAGICSGSQWLGFRGQITAFDEEMQADHATQVLFEKPRTCNGADGQPSQVWLSTKDRNVLFPSLGKRINPRTELNA